MKKILILVLMIIAGISTANAQKIIENFGNLNYISMGQADGKLYITTNYSGVWSSDIGKDNWEALDNCDSSNKSLYGTDYSIQCSGNYLFLGPNYSKDQGRTWQKFNLDSCNNVFVSHNRIFAYNSILAQQLNISKNGIDNFEQIEMNPSLKGFNMVYADSNSNTLFATSWNGVNTKLYLSKDLGRNWDSVADINFRDQFLFFNDRLMVIRYDGVFTVSLEGNIADSNNYKELEMTKNQSLHSVTSLNDKLIFCFDTLNAKGQQDTVKYYSSSDFGKTLIPIKFDFRYNFNLNQILKVGESFYYVGNRGLYKSEGIAGAIKMVSSGFEGGTYWSCYANDSYILCNAGGGSSDLQKQVYGSSKWEIIRYDNRINIYQILAVDTNLIYFYSSQTDEDSTFTGLYKSIDGGKTAKLIPNATNYLTNWNFPYYLTDSCFLHVSNKKELYVSYDETVTWTKNQKFKAISQLLIGNNTIFVVNNRILYRSTDNARTFAIIDSNISKQISFSDSTLFVWKPSETSQFGNIQKSIDLGTTWVDSGIKLDSMLYNFCILSPSNIDVKENIIIMSNNSGLFISKDYGKTWSQLFKHLIFRKNHCSFINRTTFYRFEYFHGLLSLDLTPLLNSSGVENDLVLMPNKVNVYPNPTTDFINYTINLESEANVEAEIYSLSGKLLMTDSKGILTQGKHSLFSMVNELPSGQYLMNIKIGEKTINSKFEIVR